MKGDFRQEKTLTTMLCIRNIAAPFRGGIAQLGERLHGMQEVSGSIPLTSTTEDRPRPHRLEA